MALHRFAQRAAFPTRLAASWASLAEAGALAFVLVAAGVLFQRGLSLVPSFDEGVYVAQTGALVHGQGLGTQVFAAQPPGFYWLLQLAARIGAVGVHDLRLAVLVLALVGVVAAYFVGRAVAGPVAGVAAAGVLAVAPPYPTYAAQVSADLPGCVLALLALACFLSQRRWLWVLGGALFVASELVKLDAFFVVLPALAYLSRQRIAYALGGVLAVLAATGVALVDRIGDVWHGAVSYHLAARTGATSKNLHQLGSFFDLRQPLTWLTVAGLAATAWKRRTHLWVFWAAALLGALFLLWHRPLHDNHMVLLSVLLAVPIGVALVRAARAQPLLFVVLVLALAAAYVQETRRLERNAGPVPAELVWAAGRVDAATAPSERIVSDEPLVAVLANRVMPGDLIDTAVLRFDAGYLHDADVLAAIARDHVRVVVAGRAFLQRPQLLAALRARFPRVVANGGVRIYSRP